MTINKEKIALEIKTQDVSTNTEEEFLADVSPYFQLKWDKKEKKWTKIRF